MRDGAHRVTLDFQESAVESRRLFIDAVRGAALVFMVLNHTARWWMDGSMGWGRYWLIYASVVLAGPTFLFLVGFSLAVATHTAMAVRGQPFATVARRNFVRGLRIIAAGYLLNLVVFPDEPLLSGGVLQTIGLSIILAIPALYALRWPGAPYALAAIAIVLYVSFVQTFGGVTTWVSTHRTAGLIWFYDFPPWPWFALVLAGLVLGWSEVRLPDARARARHYVALALGGVALLAGFVTYHLWTGTPMLHFDQDFTLNHHWTPRGVTLAWVFGGIACQLALAYYLMEVKRYSARALVILGQTALMLYFVHQIVVYTVVKNWLGLVFNHWGLYGLANALLLVALTLLAAGWLRVRPLMPWARGRKLVQAAPPAPALR
ncbi:MAG TPA: heparan-alpha-glucosaminide N-acetyltransferase domain-containing protein [Methylomirabilota bacterium]